MRPAWEARPFEDAPVPSGLPERDEIAAYHLMDEMRLVGGLVERAIFTATERNRIADRAARLVRAARANRHKHGGVDAFMHEYGLTSEEGIILMCLAEALLRIPDKDTADALIAEKIGGGRWEKHLGHSDSLFVNASTFGLMITGRVVRLGEAKGAGPAAVLKRLVARSGEPFIRQALRQAMKVLGDNFVLGPTIEEALARAAPLEAKGYRFSYDMLGERAKRDRDADGYFSRYMSAIEAVGKAAPVRGALTNQALMARPSISVKLSAIHPRFDPGKEERLDARAAAAHCRSCCGRSPVRRGAYHRCRGTGSAGSDAWAVCGGVHGSCACGLAGPGPRRAGLRQTGDPRAALAAADGRARRQADSGATGQGRLLGQRDQMGTGARARRLSRADAQAAYRCVLSRLPAADALRQGRVLSAVRHPQRAGHCRRSVAATSTDTYEFQRLHGMGEAVYEEVVGSGKLGVPCRIYAPVGPHADLVAYLVRRLLENGANTSFVNRLANEEAPIAEIIRIPWPRSKRRRNSRRASACCRSRRKCSRRSGQTAAGWRWTSRPCARRCGATSKQS